MIKKRENVGSFVNSAGEDLLGQEICHWKAVPPLKIPERFTTVYSTTWSGFFILFLHLHCRFYSMYVSHFCQSSPYTKCTIQYVYGAGSRMSLYPKCLLEMALRTKRPLNKPFHGIKGPLTPQWMAKPSLWKEETNYCTVRRTVLL